MIETYFRGKMCVENRTAGLHYQFSRLKLVETASFKQAWVEAGAPEQIVNL